MSEPLLIQAHSEYRAGRYREAERMFRELAAKYPSAETFNGLAIALAKQDRLAEAEGFLRRAIQLRPNYAPAYENLARCCQMKSDYSEAEKCYRVLVQLCPFDAAAHDGLAKALREQKRSAEGIAFLQRA